MHIGEGGKSASWQREFLYFVCTSLWHFCCLCALVWWTKETEDPRCFTVRWTEEQQNDLPLVFTSCDVFVRFQPSNKLVGACPCEMSACHWKFRILINYRRSYPLHKVSSLRVSQHASLSCRFLGVTVIDLKHVRIERATPTKQANSERKVIFERGLCKGKVIPWLN